LFIFRKKYIFAILLNIDFIKMYNFTEKEIKEIINEHIHLFGNIKPPQYTIVLDDFDCDGYGCTIGPIENEYGIAINIKDFEFDTKEAVIAVVLHELVHYSLLLQGKQSKNDIHDEEFINLAAEIEEKSGIKGVISNGWIGHLIRNKKKTRNILLVKQDGKWVLTQLKSKKEFNHWKKYLSESVLLGEFDDYKIFTSNKCIFDCAPLTTKKKFLNAIGICKEDEYMFLSK